MNDTIHVIFGNLTHQNRYIRAMAVNPRYVVMATRPDRLLGMTTNDIKTIKVIRYPEEVWKPTTFPCEKRVAETERMIKGYQRLGITVVEVTE